MAALCPFSIFGGGTLYYFLNTEIPVDTRLRFAHWLRMAGDNYTLDRYIDTAFMSCKEDLMSTFESLWKDYWSDNIIRCAEALLYIRVDALHSRLQIENDHDVYKIDYDSFVGQEGTVSPDSWIFYSMVEDMASSELIYRMSFYELAPQAFAVARGINRGREFGRRLTIRKPYWPFPEKPVVYSYVRRTKARERLVLKPQYPKKKVVGQTEGL